MTIDDLRALVELLQSEDATADTIEMTFTGGTFTDPEDLRKLTDAELASVTVKTRSVEVSLSDNDALVVGDARLSALVSHSWARRRRVTRLPAAMRRRASWVMVVTPLIFGAAGLLSGFILSIGDLSTLLRSIFIGTAIGTTLGVLISIATFTYARSTVDYAIVIPLTLEEYREQRGDSRRHLQIAIIALAGVVVALLGVLVTLLVAQ
ncbi:hypothetical protein [Actinophytocola sp. KF-1]